MSALDFYRQFRQEAAKAIVGQEEAVSLCAIALVAQGHVLLEGVPGVGKTLLAKTVAAILALDFRRLQFTPDLMPADVVGTAVYDLQSRSFRIRRGPVFTNILLADEINRAPAKVQSALLEAMEERGVTLEGEQLALPDPFMVLATQNPIEYEGTYPLPEAQRDRFLFKIALDYPAPEEEVEVLRRWDSGTVLRDPVQAGVRSVLGGDAVADARKEVQAVTLDEGIRRYIVELCLGTRRSPELALGASTRAEVLLLLASKTYAAFMGRDYATPDDVKALIRPTLRHRLLLLPEAEVAGRTADAVLDATVAQVAPPR